MKDQIMATIFAASAVVLLCFVAFSYGQEEGEFLDDLVKRDRNPDFKSANFDRNAISDFMKGMPRASGRNYLIDPYQKRQFGRVNNFSPAFGLIEAKMKAAAEQELEEAIQNQVALNKIKFQNAGKR